MKAAITRDPGQGIAIDTAAGPVTVYLARRHGRRGFTLLVDGPAQAVRRLADRRDPVACAQLERDRITAGQITGGAA